MPPRPLAVVLLALAGALFTVPFSGAGTRDAREAPRAVAAPEIHSVTLITGDVVRVVEHAGGRRSISLEPGAGGTIPEAAISEVGKHVYVVPEAAVPLLAANRLDLDLFDVAGLIRQRYDDARRPTLPVIVDYGRGAGAAERSRAARLGGARKTVELDALGAAAFAADKERARSFWRSLTAEPDTRGAPTALADGATRVDLDGRVRATLDASVAQIHAPQAWAAGYDGDGAVVAVLDSGYDPTHPDLAGPVTGSANFTREPSVVDGNGHGTHVASTIAGSGAGSSGLYRGVAPGADLLVGKVLESSGFGEDSWVLAGMQWAVAAGADVVNMSLGGDVTDGTDPLSRAVDELSAASDTLFVVAAGNNGGEATVTAPGAAAAALTVGAVDGGDALAWFSSRGPRLGDGAVKPDLVAPGVGITAARAAGTALGVPENELYTSLEGTSMAAPHVAGVAAILKDEHPGWDGERLKAALTGSAVPVPGATGFEAGTGRVDAERAIAQTVVSSPSLNLGYFPYPQSELSPTRTPLVYTNLGAGPVELALSVTGQDPSAGPPAGVSLSASTVTVPAGGEATVDVVLDPSLPGAGAFSGVITADGGQAGHVRTAFGFGVESEHYDLTVVVEPREGTQRASHIVGLIGLENGSYDQRTVDGTGTQSLTFRVPPGLYGTGAITFGLAGDEAQEGVLTYEPTVRVGSDATVVLDGAQVRQFGYTTSRPAVSDGQIMSVDWSGAGGFVNFTLAGAVDRLYARPFSSSGEGTVDAALNWMLSQPDAELTPGGGAPVGLRTVPASTVEVAAEGSYRVVDAGAVGALDTSSARRAVALVAGSCGELADAASALAAAGASAMVAYPGDGADCAGALGRPVALPVYHARPYDAARLLGTGARNARLDVHRTAKYIYDLAGAWSGSVPAGATLDGSARRVAALVEQYDSLGGTTKQGHEVWEMMIGWVPGRGSAAYGLVRPVAVPATVTHYVSPIAEWDRTVEVKDAAGFPEAMFWSPKAPVTAGTTTRDRWLGGPIASNVSPAVASLGWQASPYRQGDWFWLFMPPFTDDGGHMGSVLYLDEFEGKLFRDGELVMEADDPIWLQGEAPPELHDYRLVYSTHRRNGFWQRSTSTETAWEFSSGRTEGDHEVLPLLSVDYDLPLSKLGIAPPRAYSFGLRLRMPPGVAEAPLVRLEVEISWDGGASWAPAGPPRCASDGCTVEVDNRRGSASLRVTAEDARGRSVVQTVIDAYAVS